MKKKLMCVMMSVAMTAALLAGCGSSSADAESNVSGNDAEESSAEDADAKEAKEETEKQETADGAETDAAETETLEATTVTIFAAKSLNTVMEELITAYNETQPNVTNRRKL